jgi:RND family efflux transporter MFP subunit
LLAEIVAPELDHQIAQAEATLGQLRAALQQAEANRDLAQVTWNRDSPLVSKGWVTGQQGTIDVQTLKAQEAAVAVARANVIAEEAQLQVLHQHKIYQRVVAPFDGVITQRNVDIGSLVQADATSGTFMFTIMQGNVIRTQVFVPQDAAFGLQPGIDAVVRVPEIPGRTFPGKVTRIANALQPGSRTLLTEIDIPNPEGTLTPGIYCTIELHILRKTPSYKVSADAIIFNEAGLQVAVVENDVVHLRKVAVIRDFGQEVEVNSGVKRGDQVILNPAVDLADGSKVRADPRVGAWLRSDFSLQTAGAVFSVSETRSGWTVGVGGEYAFLDWLTGFIEYDHYGFRDDNGVSFGCGALCTIGTVAAFPINIRTDVDVVKAGLNLKFGPTTRW